MMPTMSKRAIILTTAIIAAVLCVDGATTHVSAALLRAVLICICVAAWPQKQVMLQGLALVAVATASIALLWGLTISNNPGLGIQVCVTGILICGLYLALLHSEENIAQTLLLILVAVAVVHSIAAIFHWGMDPSTRASGYFANPNNLAAWLAPSALVLLYFYIQNPANRWALLGILLCTAAVMLTQSRSGILALLVGAACFVSQMGRFKKYGLAALTLAGIAATALLYNRLTGEGDPLSFSRLAIWKSSLAVALAHPEGVGLANFGPALRMHGVELSGLVHYPRFAQQAHNAILHGWVEAGFLGLIAIVAAFLTAATGVWRSGKSWSERLPHMGVFAAFLIPALFSTTFHLVIISATAAVWTAFVTRLSFSPGPFGEEKSWDHIQASVGALGIVLIGFLVPGALNQHYQSEAQSFSQAGNLSRAQKSAEDAVESAPFSVGAKLLLESLKFRQGEGPLPIAERLLDLGDLYPMDHRPVERASALLAHAANQSGDQGLWGKSAAIGLAGLERNPHDCLTRVPIGRALYRSGQHNQSIKFLQETIEIEPQCAGAHANLALIHRIAQNSTPSHAHALKALEAHAHSQTRIAREKQILSLAPATKKVLETIVNGQP
jgi:O-antigen ligase